MLKRKRNGTLQDLSKGALAVFEHAFDDHIYCEEEWCLPSRKKLKTGNLHGDSVPSNDEHLGSTAHSPQPERPTYYRCKIADNKLREQIWEVLEPCIHPHCLMELLHSWDTSLNEAMNQIVAK